MGAEVFVVKCEGCSVCWGGMGVDLGWCLLRESAGGVWEAGEGCGAGKAREMDVVLGLGSGGSVRVLGWNSGCFLGCSGLS